MILSDEDLRYYIEKKKLVIESINEKTIRENGLDLTIGDEIGIENVIKDVCGYDKSYEHVIDSHNEDDVKNRFKIVKANKEDFKQKMHNFSSDEKYFIVEPHSLNLLTTQEYVKFPDDLMGFCAVRSSIARHGFICPMTIIDAGFEGTLTIEVIYSGIRPFKLYVGDRFLHVIICKTSSPVRNLYSGVYKGQNGIRIPKCLD